MRSHDSHGCVIRGSVNGRPLAVEIGMDFDPGYPSPRGEKCASPRCTESTATTSMMSRLVSPADHKWAGRVICAWHMAALGRRIWKSEPNADIRTRDVPRIGGAR